MTNMLFICDTKIINYYITIIHYTSIKSMIKYTNILNPNVILTLRNYCLIYVVKYTQWYQNIEILKPHTCCDKMYTILYLINNYGTVIGCCKTIYHIK